MRRQLLPGLRMVIAMTILTGFAYTFAMTGIVQALFHTKANGSIVTKDGHDAGSALLGQNFASPEYFHPRPSAAGSGGYDGTSSGGSQLGATNPVLSDTVLSRVEQYRQENGLPAGTPVPEDAVTASGSGLDPDISVANAYLQVDRVALARGVSPERVRALVDAVKRPRLFGFLGEPRVNVLTVNLALDSAGLPPAPSPTGG